MSDAESSGPLSQADIDAALGVVDGGAAVSAEPPAAEAAAPQPDTRVDAAGKPFDAAAAMMAAAIEEEKAAAPAPAPAPPPAPAPAPPPAAQAIPLPDLARGEEPDGGAARNIDLLRDVDLHVKIELGRSRMFVEDVLRLTQGSVVELDKLAGDPVDVLVNERLVARGEVLVLNDNFCVRINEILSPVEDVA